LPTNLGGVQVSVNGAFAPLFYAGPDQVNFQAPLETSVYAGAAANVVVYNNGVPSNTASVALGASSPTISRYYRTASIIDPVILRAVNNQLVTPTAPTSAGDILIAYGTGIGSPTCTLNSGDSSGGGCLAKPVPVFTFPD